MTSEHLQISGQDLLELKYKHPLELEVIMEMLEEAGEGFYLEEMEAFENPSEVAQLGLANDTKAYHNKNNSE